MLRIGTVGTNFITSQMLDAISRVEEVECTVVSSRRYEIAKALADPWGVAHIVPSFEELLTREDVDAVYLASPNALHVSQCLQAIRAGKHVICEKPLAVSEQQAQEVFQAARDQQRFVFEAISTLYMPNFLQCRVQLPRLGSIYSLTCRYTQYSSRLAAYLRGEPVNVFDPAMQGGALNDLGVYAIHAIVRLLGRPETVSYAPITGYNGVDLAGTLTMRYTTPTATASVFCAKDRAAESGFSLDGEKGSIRQQGPLNAFANCTFCLPEYQQQPQPLEGQPAPVVPDAVRLTYELTAFRDAIAQNDTTLFEEMAAQSIAVAWVLEQAHASANKEGGI